jgi:DNA-3-methyladenine glycosylase II
MARCTPQTRPVPFDWQQACRELAAADPRLGRLIARCPAGGLRVAAVQSPFEALAESIVYQQLHGKAAATIHRRLLESFHPICGPRTHPAPQHILDAPDAQLRAAGLSANKLLALRSLAQHTLDGTVPTLAQARRLSDDALIERLTQVRGIGCWSVEMFLIFRLGRPNVLPVDDYGVRKGFALTYLGLKPSDKVTPDRLPTRQQMERRAHRWQPWSTVASWYMWRACDLAKEADITAKPAKKTKSAKKK